MPKASVLAPLIALPDKPLTDRFLATGASPETLIQATANNHRHWFTANALICDGEVGGDNNLTWIYTPGPNGEVTLAFPHLTRAQADATLDRLIRDCREKKPRTMSCWSLLPTYPPDLGAQLTARGFEWGWQPHWMALDLHDIRTDFPLPENFEIVVDDVTEWDVKDLPYYNPQEAARFQQLSQATPRRFWHFAARQNGKVVGHTMLFVTTGDLGVAGLYSVGVVPEAQRQGIGRAVTLAACQFARALGCHYATLNSATHIYDRLGFVSLGYGQSWWMHKAVIDAPMPTSAQIAFVEALVRGDVAAMNALPAESLPADLDAPLPNDATPINLSVQAEKPASVEWLIGKGATLSVLQAWDLGWKERATQMLADNPELVNRRSGSWQTTPLHEAAQRNDVELARFLLSFHPDLDAKDTEFHSTPLGWARHMHRAEIVALIEAHQRAQLEK